MGLIGKLKRKDIDQVNDDFSDFSLSSPATKIRRLDADLPPIIEEDSLPENHEKAIVLFNPNPLHLHDTPPLSSPPSTLSFSFDSHLLSGFKDQILRAADMKSAETEENKMENEGCLAVVPWVPSQIASVESRDSEQQVLSLMETDEMDVEENCSNNGSMQEEHGYELDGLKPRDALHNWAQQQHCMLPQPPQNPFTPITWSD
ncbi:DBH-like monooxygenase protein 2 [Gossypium arboreum]|uniref:DBH-like monooxygenase protein 2 n=2 Tax=Gossypium arboreum TaxID=29729 RepID=A0A0B0MTS3_GOSAR|nr:uncharacterized protein LOC108458126 [Gossypium arboreum]KAK5834698.1 hypothetical protein PVK06_010374 [Gossypium arboreum]KHG02311.1 DBH-like monooxygenase protein 2 [Gossypium arboreum]